MLLYRVVIGIHVPPRLHRQHDMLQLFYHQINYGAFEPNMLLLDLCWLHHCAHILRPKSGGYRKHKLSSYSEVWSGCRANNFMFGKTGYQPPRLTMFYL